MLDRIPYEIFSKIIKISSALHPIFLSFSRFDISLPPIEATHVCRSWRTALLSDPTMWTCIMLINGFMTCPEQLDATLSRSRSAPLDILISQGGQVLDSHIMLGLCDMLSIISLHMHRCRQLQVAVSPDFASHIFQCLHKPAPILQTFDLEVFGNASRERIDKLGEIHENLFSGDAPSLKHVHLQAGADLGNLRLSILKNLSSLYLNFDLDIINGDILLDILQSSPSLRSLAISFLVKQQATILSRPSDHRIHLPYLQELYLHGICAANTANLLLARLDFPMETLEFYITCQDSHSDFSKLTSLVRLLNRRCLTFLSIYTDRYQQSIEFSETIAQGPTDSRFKAEIYSPSASVDDPLKFLRTFNLLNITHMSLRSAWPKSVLRSIFVALANLQYLRITASNNECIPSNPPVSRSYLEALMPRLQHLDPDGRASLDSETGDITTSRGPNDDAAQGPSSLFPCPSLQTLEIMFFYETSTRLDETYFQTLHRCARIRKQAGHPFKYKITCRANTRLAEDIRTWLRNHEGFSVEVRLLG